MTSEKQWVLTDVARGIWLPEIAVGPADTGMPSRESWRIRKWTYRGGLADGVDAVEVDNGQFSFIVLPTRGMGLWQGRYRGLDVGWSSPVQGPVHPFYINALERGGLGWLRGFNECIVRCGLNFNGAPVKDIVPDNNGNPAEIDLTLHGHIANIPAHQVSIGVTPGARTILSVTGVVDEAMLFGPRLRLTTTISTEIGSNVVTILDRVTNIGDTKSELSLLYHCNFGMPFLEDGAEILAPSLEVAPRDARAQEGIDGYRSYLPPTPGYVEQVYWHDMACAGDGSTMAALANAARDKAVVVRYNKNQLPSFAQWKNTAGLNDGYVTGLEPGVNFPNPRPFERSNGRIPKLAPGETYEAEVAVQVLDNSSAVSAAVAEVKHLLDGRTPRIYDRPQPRWSMV